MRARISEKVVEVQPCSRIAELEEANVVLCVELAAAHTKVVEVERRERALTSNYGSLHSDFNDLQSVHAVVVKEKTDLEKMERAHRFHNLLRKKLAELRRDMEESIAALGGRCLDFPATNAIVPSMLEWFCIEVQALPTTFAECNEHLPKFKKLALSCNASVLHSIPDNIGKITRKLVKYWWTKHGLPYCMQKLEEGNQVTFAAIHFDKKEGWSGLIFANNSGFSQPEIDEGLEGVERGVGADGGVGGAGGSAQAEAMTEKADVADAAKWLAAADAAATTEVSPEAEIPQRSEVCRVEIALFLGGWRFLKDLKYCI
jgi:hypothetical protein